MALVALSVLAAAPGRAQAQQTNAPSTEDMQVAQGARTAETGTGDIGQRQTREEVAPYLVQTGRIISRVQNRVQNRIRNRIDRNYDPQANAASPFEAATDRARTAGRRTQR
jgi:hypothetical protein